MNLLNRLRRYKGVRYVKVTLAVCAWIFAVAVVTTVTVDLGPAVRRNAETLGTTTLKRPVHIGRLSIRLLTGHIVVDDFSIDGLEPADRPFFTAKRLEVSLDWSTACDARHHDHRRRDDRLADARREVGQPDELPEVHAR